MHILHAFIILLTTSFVWRYSKESVKEDRQRKINLRSNVFIDDQDQFHRKQVGHFRRSQGWMGNVGSHNWISNEWEKRSSSSCFQSPQRPFDESSFWRKLVLYGRFVRVSVVASSPESNFETLSDPDDSRRRELLCEMWYPTHSVFKVVSFSERDVYI